MHYMVYGQVCIPYDAFRNDMDNIGKTIRTLRKAKRYTQADIASKLQMSRATISGIENGTVSEIGIRKVEAILNLLGHTLAVVPRSRRPTLDQLKEQNFHD
jgi:transcriptional regulator with XRE-family HTH domain